MTADDGSLTFTALDRTERTDTWMSNREELNAGLAVWDPDTDDDGLTDGQEEFWVTSLHTGGASLVQKDRALETDPTSADTDGDGYWDGWIGVYGVGRSENVVLYMEHLRDDDESGITTSEKVSEQTGVHNVSEAPSNLGADLDGDGTLEHSNVHIGELHWGPIQPRTKTCQSPV